MNGKRSRLRIALDENFPTPLLDGMRSFIPDADLVGVVDIDRRMRGLRPDWRVVVALHHLKWPIFVTNDHHALDVPKTIAAVASTGSTFIAIEDTGADPLRAIGALMLELPGLLKAYRPDIPTIYRWHPRPPRPMSPEGAYGALLAKTHNRIVTIEQLRRENALTPAELRSPLE